MRRSRRRLPSLLTLGGLVVVMTASPGATAQRPASRPDEMVTPAGLTDVEIQWGIDAITEGLYSLQNDAGTWERQYSGAGMESISGHVSGQTTLAVYALLASGKSYQDPRLSRAVDFLRKQIPDYTYVRSLRAHIWAQLPERFEPLLKGDRDWLLSGYDMESGSWNYTSARMESGYDNSLTQYGVLGLWEAAKRGLEVQDKVWKRVEDHVLRTQLVDGAWQYRPYITGARGSMTAAGLTCLFITQDYLHAREYARPGLTGTPPQIAIEKGLAWLDVNFAADRHPGAPGDGAQAYYFYYLYGIERVGLASGYKRFGEHDWFREGAAAVINRLCDPVTDAGGRRIGFRVKPKIAATGEVETPVVQLSFALAFLSRGRVPIIVSKLRDESMSWNNRPRDAANLVRWIGEETENATAWQVLEVDRGLAEWFDGPMVYVASHEALPWVAQHRAAMVERQRRTPAGEGDGRDAADEMTTVERLKRYLECGGLLLTSADAESRAMSESVAELAREMFPRFEWRRLPEDHWVYTLSARVDRTPELWGISNGVRDLIIHAPRGDLGLELQRNDRREGLDVFATLANLYYLSSERGMSKARLERKVEAPDVPWAWAASGVDGGGLQGLEGEAADQSVLVLRGEYAGNWNPEPAADEMLAMRLASRGGPRVRFRTVAIKDLGGASGPLQESRAILWIRGVGAHDFTAAERAGLAAYLDAGGVILFETVGGTGSFAKSAEDCMLQMTPQRGTRFARPIDSPVLTGAGLEDGVNCSEVAYRLYSLDRFGTRENRARLRALEPTDTEGQVAKRVQVFVSREDLSHALLGQPCWGVSGYTTEWATAILGNLIEHAADREAVPAGR